MTDYVDRIVHPRWRASLWAARPPRSAGFARADRRAAVLIEDHLWQHVYKWTRRRHPRRADGGSPPATSASTTRPGETGGSSATAKPAPTSTATPGRRSSGTSWPPAGTHPTTLPWPSTGPTGDANANPQDHAVLGTPPAHPTRALPAVRGTAAVCGRPTRPPTQWETWYRGIRKVCRTPRNSSHVR